MLQYEKSFITVWRENLKVSAASEQSGQPRTNEILTLRVHAVMDEVKISVINNTYTKQDPLFVLNSAISSNLPCHTFLFIIVLVCNGLKTALGWRRVQILPLLGILKILVLFLKCRAVSCSSSRTDFNSRQVLKLVWLTIFITLPSLPFISGRLS